ncbi:MAG: DUF3187 family protein [Gammaproteobacteria bacterium]
MSRFALLPFGLLLVAPPLVAGTPFTTPNLSPPVLIHGSPGWTVAPEPNQRLSFELTTAVANHYSLHRNNGGVIRLDGETRYLHLGLRHRVQDRWLVGLDLNWLQHTSGGLDGVIEGWHDFFGLPDGGRDLRARDQLEFRYVNGGNSVFELTDGVSGLGDTRLGIGRILGAEANWLLWGELKLPTGDVRRLTGSGSVDGILSLTHRGSSRWRRPLDWYWGIAVSRLGSTDLPGASTKDWVTSGMAGFSLAVFPRVALVGQIEASTPHYQSNLNPLANAALPLTLGATIGVGERSWVDLAIVEDLSVNASPDITFIINFTFNR